MIIYWGRHSKTARLQRIELESIGSFYENFIVWPVEGEKGGPYITTASEVEITLAIPENTTDFRNTDHYRRNNKTHLSSWCVAIDGDRSEDNDEFCISPYLVTAALRKLNINHIIYTTPSHTEKTPKWRLLVFCNIPPQENIVGVHKATVAYLYKLLKENGCENLKEQNESYTLSQMWFLPVNTDDYYQSMYVDGNDLEPQEAGSVTPTVECETNEEGSKRTIQEQLMVISTGISPLHECMRDYIYGAIEDGDSKAKIKATLHELTRNYDTNDKRLRDRKNDINRLVDLTYKKKYENLTKAPPPNPNKTVPYTEYPDQGGNFERLVQIIDRRMLFKNRPIAVAAARFLVSVLGARVYTSPSGSGLVQTMLLTGRSTIGKGEIKKVVSWILNNIYTNNFSEEFLGSVYYTSVKNIFEDANGRYSLGNIKSESGQMDKSKAGDMSRVLMYELEAATQSGRDGFISSGGQNDRVPMVFSPGITTLRESVAEIQNEADITLNSSINGVTGRRSHIIANPHKAYINRNRITKIPDRDKEWLIELITLARNDARKDWTKPIPANLWVEWSYEDIRYLESRQDKWVDIENEATKRGDSFASTTYGRMHERVPAYAALLAVCDNPKEPCITNTHLDIAERSILAEVNAFKLHCEDGELSSPWDRLGKQVREIFTDPMTRHLSRYPEAQKASGLKELKDNSISWSPLSVILQHNEAYKTLKAHPYFKLLFAQHAETWNIRQLSKDEVKEKYGSNISRTIYKLM